MSAAEIEPVDPSTEVRAAYARFLLSTLGRTRTTVAKYDNVLGQVARQLPDGDLVAATPTQLKQVFVMGAWAQALTTRTKRSALATVIGFRVWLAEDACLVPEAGVADLRKLAGRLGPAASKLPTYLTMPEVDRLMVELGCDVVDFGSQLIRRPRFHGTRDQAITAVMAYAGGRLTETVQGLQVSDVDLDGRVITFRTRTKRGKQRSVPISPLLRPRLEAWLRVRDGMPKIDTQALFITSRGMPFAKSEEWPPKTLHPAAERAGLQWVACDLHGRNGCRPGQRGAAGGCPQAGWRVHPHALRHSFAVEALLSGACNIAELRDLLGHSNIATTNIYLSLVPNPGTSERFRRRFGKQGQ